MICARCKAICQAARYTDLDGRPICEKCKRQYYKAAWLYETEKCRDCRRPVHTMRHGLPLLERRYCVRCDQAARLYARLRYQVCIVDSRTGDQKMAVYAGHDLYCQVDAGYNEQEITRHEAQRQYQHMVEIYRFNAQKPKEDQVPIAWLETKGAAAMLDIPIDERPTRL